ncbi:MAG: aminotransferase class III-fold pyridoxal phosphate-dependent enzyme, partial [Planctomycetota bacterium]|nr:aminotransferase class III-fold pyridoxal phosphate-dependent enzyme [Planctomycetota bacterium]
MSETERLTRLDFEHVWHPFTPMRQWRAGRPVIIERGEGFRLFDTEGTPYIDGFSSLWCNVHGHRVPEIDDAVRAQLEKVAHATMLGHATVPAIEFAERLVGVVNRNLPEGSAPLNKVFYSDAGATATEVAFKMAVGHHFHRGETQRDTFIGFTGAYHGDTMGAMSIGYVELFHRPFRRLVFRSAWAPAPDVYLNDGPTDDAREWPSWDCDRRERVKAWALDEFDRILDEVGDRCAGVVIEPLMQGAAGMVEQPHGFLGEVARRVRERGLLLIADEVAVGFGRTGSMFAWEQEEAAPDILCLGKGISGGYMPLAATVAT